MLIGLAGKAGSGKDTACQFILEWANAQGRPARRDAFADRLKISAARALCPHTLSDKESITFCDRLKQEGQWVVTGVEKTDHGFSYHSCISGRAFLQRYGTEAHREVFDKDFWVRAVLGGYDSEEILVVTDARFPNEAEGIRDAGGQVWEIQRQGSGVVEDGHASEQPLPIDLVDRFVVNEGTLEEFRDRLLWQVKTLV